MLHFSQCTDSGMQSQGPSQVITSAMSGCRLGTPAQVPLSLELPDSQDDSMLRDMTNQAMPDSCSQLALSQFPSQLPSQQFYCTPDFLTPVEQQFDGKQAQPSFRTPAALSPSRAKRPRNTADFDRGSDGNSSQPFRAPATFMPPTSRKVVKVRQKSPVCLKNVFAGNSFAEDDEINTGLRKLPRAQQPTSRFRADFKEVRVLGQGNFSKVLHVKHRLDGMEYAIKRSMREISADSLKRQWIQEVHAWARLPPHPNIVRYHAAWLEPGTHGEHVYIQLEKCDVSLGQHFALMEHNREPELVEVLRQVASALQHVHAHGMVHMDVKPDNVYTTASGTYKLGDFGLATQAAGDVNDTAISEGDCRYMAQEVLQDDFRHLDKADMFGLGATLYELASGSSLPSSGSLYHQLREGKLQLLPNLTAPFQKMLKALMHPNPQERPSPTKVLASQLVQKRSAAGRSDAGAPLAGCLGGLNLQPTRS